MSYDLFVACVLTFTTLRGAAKGVAWQLAGLAAIVLCFLFATPFSLSLAPYIALEPPLNRWVAMLGIYVVFSFGTFAVARVFKEGLEQAKFEAYDRHLGALFGCIKGVAFSIVMTFFVVSLAHQSRDYILHTRSGFASAWIMDRLDRVMPEELHAVLGPFIHELDQPGTEPDISLGDASDFDGDRGSNPAHGGADGADLQSGYWPAGQQPDPNANPDSGSSTTVQLEQEIASMLGKIPGLLDAQLRKLVLEALKNTLPEDRAELVDQITTASPERIHVLARAWRSGKPVTASHVRATATTHDVVRQSVQGRAPEVHDLGRSRQKLTRQIVSAISDHANVQQKKAAEIEASLEGVPDTVAVSVLSDWLADLLAQDPDPDSETDLTTPLDIRIVRQMDRAGVPLSRLAGNLQHRLRSAVRR